MLSHGGLGYNWLFFPFFFLFLLCSSCFFIGGSSFFLCWCLHLFSTSQSKWMRQVSNCDVLYDSMCHFNHLCFTLVHFYLQNFTCFIYMSVSTDINFTCVYRIREVTSNYNIHETKYLVNAHILKIKLIGILKQIFVDTNAHS